MNTNYIILNYIYFFRNDLTNLPFTMGLMPLLKSVQVDGNPMKSIRRDIIARGTVGLLKYLR